MFLNKNVVSALNIGCLVCSPELNFLEMCFCSLFMVIKQCVVESAEILNRDELE